MIRPSRGFTLIEVLVALAVFGVLSLLAYMTLGQTLSNSDLLTERMDRLQAIQRTVRLLSSDFLQAAPRPIRSELGDSWYPAIYSDTVNVFPLEVTHGGWGNPAALPRGTQQRSAYRIEENELVRYHWNVLDRTFTNEPVATVLLDDIESMHLRFLQSGDDWSETWPPEGVPESAARRLLPRAIEFVLVLADEGEIRRLIEVVP